MYWNYSEVQVEVHVCKLYFNRFRSNLMTVIARLCKRTLLYTGGLKQSLLGKGYRTDIAGTTAYFWSGFLICRCCVILVWEADLRVISTLFFYRRRSRILSAKIHAKSAGRSRRLGLCRTFHFHVFFLVFASARFVQMNFALDKRPIRESYKQSEFLAKVTLMRVVRKCILSDMSVFCLAKLA